jgi:single-strand DNA-binding protein
MNNLNSILIEGNLVKDPILRSTPKGTQVCTMTLASNRYCKVDSGFEKEVSFFDVVTWARLAEQCYDKGRKGRGIRVVGRLNQDRWTDNDGRQQSKIKIVAEHVEFRPEFKKDEDAQSTANTSVVELDSPYPDYSDSEVENAEPILATAKELEPVF